MTATVAPYETTEHRTVSRPVPPPHAAGDAAPDQRQADAAGWLAGVPTTPTARADPQGWYQRALAADAGAPGIPVLLLPGRRLSASERAQAQALSRHPLVGTDRWAGPTWSALVKADRQVVTHAGVLSRVVTVGGRQVPVGGLTGVATLAAWRGRGYAQAAVAKATAFAGIWLWAPFLVALCPRADTGFYEHTGWRVAAADVACDQVPLEGYVALSRTAQGEAAWPSGAIDLCGLPW